ncbi:3-isopropylmalate dehydratase small subunit [Candidatus Nitrosotenuis cloacae]|uniref:3-isopropylmalate dehydratase small subunit n=1 Tax=Candidatus Nitrosotenuis cloacae TaxID=1603555 RepID=UPI0022801DF1|nr:3-isopropylmalate dehydratase small subunit [Candidatus Nitrosotenuis cloacae]
MEKFHTVSSIATPLDRSNVDTDQMVPKQFLKLVQRTGFGKFLFHDWRFEQDGSPKKDFALNDPKYSNSHILISGENFGCGSSREHAAWALKDYGFDVVIAPSFADIFYNNCFKNGILPISVSRDVLNDLLKTSLQMTVDLSNQTIRYGDRTILFEIEENRKRTLLEGLDDIALTLQQEDKILAYEKSH